jgi:hypothetical protein
MLESHTRHSANGSGVAFPPLESRVPCCVGAGALKGIRCRELSLRREAELKEALCFFWVALNSVQEESFSRARNPLGLG